MATTTYDEGLRQRLLELLGSGSMTQAELARQIGYTAAAISQYKSGGYPSDVSKIQQALREFFVKRDTREDIRTAALAYGCRRNYIRTATSEDAYKLMRYAQIEKKLVVIYGDTGIGKTKAAYKFADDNPSSVVYITSSPSSRSLRSTLKLLARELRLPITRTDDLAYAVRKKLQDEDKTLIIDEAQCLTVSVVDEITRWVDPDQDTGEGRMSIVLIGNDGVLEKFNGQKDERRYQNMGRACLSLELRSSRIGMEDVRKLFPVLAEQDAKKELELLLAVSRSVTGVRAAVEVYNSAVNAGKVDCDTMASFARQKKAIAV